MPQKKNPDSLELMRGRTGRVIGCLIAMLTVLKGLPLAYNSDLQEDKEGLFYACDTLGQCLRAAAEITAGLRFDATRMKQAAGRGHSTATELADFLARQGLPFREAHGVVGRLVLLAEETGRSLEELSLDELQALSPLLDEQALRLLAVEEGWRQKRSRGGTGPEQVARALSRSRTLLQARTR